MFRGVPLASTKSRNEGSFHTYGFYRWVPNDKRDRVYEHHYRILIDTNSDPHPLCQRFYRVSFDRSPLSVCPLLSPPTTTHYLPHYPLHSYTSVNVRVNAIGILFIRVLPDLLQTGLYMLPHRATHRHSSLFTIASPHSPVASSPFTPPLSPRSLGRRRSASPHCRRRWCLRLCYVTHRDRRDGCEQCTLHPRKPATAVLSTSTELAVAAATTTTAAAPVVTTFSATAVPPPSTQPPSPCYPIFLSSTPL